MALDKPLSDRKAKGRGCLIPFGLVFAGMGSVFLWMLFLQPLLGTLRSSGWKEVPCTVISAKLASKSDSNGATYEIEVQYRYVFDSVPYSGDRYGFSKGSSSSRGWRQKAVSKLQPGSTASCWVNPANPSEAVLHRGLTPDAWFVFLPLIFVGVGVGVMIAGIRSGSRGRQAARKVVEMTAPLAGSSKVMQTGTRTMLRFLGIFAAAVFWNGMVWFMASKAMGSGGPPKWFVAIFLIFGLLIVWGAVHAFLALFNPKVMITMNPAAAQLGQMLGIRWEILGRTQNISALVITLEGREKASYRRGTDTVTVTSVFEKIVLLDTPDVRLLPNDSLAGRGLAGTVEITIPDASMHTFRASNNQVCWVLKLNATIPKWPDINEEFDVHVLPHTV